MCKDVFNHNVRMSKTTWIIIIININTTTIKTIIYY